MPAYNNFRNDYRRRTETDNVFLNPRQIKKEEEIAGERRERLIDWITFYRRNVHRFCSHFLKIELFPYQALWIYEMGRRDSFVAICSRAVGKTWLLSVFACARAILYPNSEICIVSSTKDQAGNAIDKIQQLYNDYPNLQREINNIVTNTNKWQVDFHNGSIIKVVASRDSSRGKIFAHYISDDIKVASKNGESCDANTVLIFG